jgi:hypothetical protein
MLQSWSLRGRSVDVTGRFQMWDRRERQQTACEVTLFKTASAGFGPVHGPVWVASAVPAVPEVQAGTAPALAILPAAIGSGIHRTHATHHV